MSNTFPIRAIAGRFSFDFSRHALENVLEKHPFEFCAHISGENHTNTFKGIPASSQEWFESGEIRNAYYKNIDWNTITPLSEELIMSMSECESVFMSLVYRLEWKRSIPYSTRKRWYLQHLQFWDHYITLHKINLYLSAWIPHEIPDIIIYHLCKKRGIPVLYFSTTEIHDISFIEHDIQKSASQILPRYQALLEQHKNQEHDTIPLSEPFASYEQALTSVQGQPPAIEKIERPTYQKGVQKLLWKQPLTFLRYALQYLTFSGWERAILAIHRWHLMRQVDHFYRKHAIEPDLNKPFVYFPLHFQPEATTVPMGGAFADLILAARLLNATLPKDMLIYVKEHPYRSSWLSRNIKYYQDLLELEKVRLVPISVDTFSLREHCRAVATVTGSPGFEALFRGKPVFLFGSRFYQYAKGVFPVKSQQDCKEAVRAIFDRGEAPSSWTTHLYLKAMEENCVRGVLDPWSLQVSQLPEAHHIRIMGQAIESKLNEIRREIEAVEPNPDDTTKKIK